MFPNLEMKLRLLYLPITGTRGWGFALLLAASNLGSDLYLVSTVHQKNNCIGNEIRKYHS